MSLTITQSDGFCTLKLEGALAIFRIAEFHKQLLEECQDRQVVVLDLHDTDELDTAGIQLLLSLEKQLKKNAGSLSLVGMNEQVSKTLEIYNLLTHFVTETESH